jgi:hypothetical protein
MNNFDCAQAAPLIPPWADGELSEVQAAPLREHLLDCRACRGSMQELRALEHWFQPGSAAVTTGVPPGFAARVARRAFAGDTGERDGQPGSAHNELARERRRSLDFVLQLTGLAALAVIGLAIGLRGRELPRGESLHADDRPRLSYEEIVQRLDGLALPAADAPGSEFLPKPEEPEQGAPGAPAGKK